MITRPESAPSHNVRNPWLTTFRRRAAVMPASVSPRVHLVCFPHAGGSASAFRPWADLAPAWMSLTGVQPPGRENRYSEPLIKDVGIIAAHILEALTPRAMEPLVFFGHSMGALIAYETARQMTRAGLAPPIALLLSGRQSPDGAFEGASLLALDDDGFLAEIGRRYGGIPPIVLENPEFRDVVVPILRADFEAVAAYRSGPLDAVDCPITLFLSSDDRLVTPENTAGWAHCSRRPLRTRRFSGGHFYLVDRMSEVVAAIAEEVELALADAVVG